MFFGPARETAKCIHSYLIACISLKLMISDTYGGAPNVNVCCSADKRNLKCREEEEEKKGVGRFLHILSPTLTNQS